MVLKWGAFDLGLEIHVTPCTSEGQILFHHQLDVKCPCCPQRDRSPGYEPGKEVYLHQLIIH
jgi:hypothetical protein